MNKRILFFWRKRKGYSMKEILKIGAKFLGSMALPGFCFRCYSYGSPFRTRPFSGFPPIFKDMDLHAMQSVACRVRVKADV
jgi:hypothetical protein